VQRYKKAGRKPNKFRFILILPEKSLLIAIVSAVVQVAQVVLMVIGFLFKANVVVGLKAVAVFHAEHKPLNDIPKEKRYIEQFTLLRSMNVLMIKLHVIQRPDSEYNAKETDGQKVIAHRQPLDKVNIVI
jgi:hypothetical protein